MLRYYGDGFFYFFILLPEYFSYVTFFSAFVLISRKSIFLLSMKVIGIHHTDPCDVSESAKNYTRAK